MEQRIKELEEENAKLKALVAQLQQQPTTSSPSASSAATSASSSTTASKFLYNEAGKILNNYEISRYSRHLLLSEVGVEGQAKICRGKILIIGLGGLGSPAALYLAACGVGKLGFVDFDVVEKSNLQRQIIHDEQSEGMLKVQSAMQKCKKLNSTIDIEVITEGFSATNALDIVSRYDVVIDATDNVITRYLINDACILAKKPLVSGSAIRMEGQLTIYGYRDPSAASSAPTCGPCYRCLFPKAPPPETVTNCSDGGVLGVVPGAIGTLQALEALKLLMNYSKDDLLVSRLLLFNAKSMNIKVAKIRGRSPFCAVCGDNPTLTDLSQFDYRFFCLANSASGGAAAAATEIKRIHPKEYFDQVLTKEKKHLLLDVRDELQFKICSLPNAVNIPLKQLPTRLDELTNLIKKEEESAAASTEPLPVYVMCRRGVASVTATRLLTEKQLGRDVVNVDGGVTLWKKEVDTNFPFY